MVLIDSTKARLVARGRLLILAALAVVAGHATQAARGAEGRPNIVFIFSDDHAVQAIGAYGSTINRTPHMDRIAREGAVFTNSFCANSLCGPSRACILTGKHSHVNGFMRNGDRFDGSQVTFPKLLQKAGYQTAVVGKWHLESDPTGFDYWEVLPGQGSYYNPDFIQMDGSRQRYEGYCTDLITDFSLAWLKERRDPDKPFVLMCQHKAPHRNWAPHPRHFAHFQEDIPLPPTFFDDYAGRSKLLAENEMTVANHMYWAHDMKFHGENQFPNVFVSGGRNAEYDRMTDEQKRTWDAHYEPENQAFIEQMTAGKLSEQEIINFKFQRYVKDYLRCVQAVDDSVGRVLDYLD
ncbi:MAG: sulfatase-like hydrolase/transferase, partial [Planctomycetaceae bacterium]